MNLSFRRCRAGVPQLDKKERKKVETMKSSSLLNLTSKERHRLKRGKKLFHPNDEKKRKKFIRTRKKSSSISPTSLSLQLTALIYNSFNYLHTLSFFLSFHPSFLNSLNLFNYRCINSFLPTQQLSS